MWRKCRKKSQGLRGAARVMAFFLVVASVCCWAAVRNARAEVERRTTDLGQKLLNELGPLVLDAPQAIDLNGQRMYVSSIVTNLSPEATLGHFESYCRKHSGGLAEAIGQLPERVSGKALSAELRDPSRWMTVKSEGNANYGQITCFARDDQGTLRSFVERLDAFMRSGDLALLGNLRYAVARKTPNGKTHVLVMWTEGHFDIAAMFPPNADSPGGDSPAAPRPPASERLLSARISDRPYALYVYDSTRNPEELLAFYDREMTIRGFSHEAVWLEHPGDPHTTAKPSYARAFSKAGSLVLVTALDEPVGGKATQVSLIEMGGRGEVPLRNVALRPSALGVLATP